MKCYKCQSELPPAGSHCPSCGQAVYTKGVKPGEKSLGRRLDGCLPETPSPSDYRAVPNLVNLPRQVDLREHCSPVEDQGQVGSCTANAVVGAMEYQIRKDGKPAVDLSRMFVYFNARRMSGHEGQDTGAKISQGMAAFLAFGSPAETDWPYDPNLIDKVPDDGIFKKALSHVPAEYARIDGFENVKASLARGYPVVFAASLPERYWNEVRATGRAKTPTRAELDGSFTDFGRHAMLLVGYDLNDNEFLVRNSWGPDWGEKGYFRIDMDALTASTAPHTTWILGKLEAADFTIHRPSVEVKPESGGVKDLAAKLRDDIRGSLTKDIKDSFKDIKDRAKKP